MNTDYFNQALLNAKHADDRRQHDLAIIDIETYGYYLPKKGFIYIIQDKPNKRYKIGKSIDPSQRIKQLGAGNPDIVLIACYFVYDMDLIEKSLHKHFNDSKLGREWFTLANEQLDELHCILSIDSIDSTKDKPLREWCI